MSIRRAAITGVGRYVPPKVVTNHDLAERVETNHDWIVERTGIEQRHVVEPGVPTSELATKAAADLLARRGIEAGDVDLIIVVTVTPDMMFPATACLVQDKLRATRAWGFDLSAACSGFLYGLTVGAQFIMTGAHQKVMVIGADVMTSILNPEDRSTLVLFGDGAGAVLLEPVDDPSVGILDFTHMVDGSGGQFLYMPGGGSLNPASHETVEKKMHYVHQQGQSVFKFAVRTMAELSERILERNGLTGESVDLFISHQANARIIDATGQKLGLPAEKVLKNINKFANTTAATIPLALGDALEQGRLKRGDCVLFAAVGAGFTGGTVLCRWAY